jgi:type I restriction enzyme S subunit
LEGNGAFHRETKLGNEISASLLDRVETGDFIYSRLFACRGAFSLIGPDLGGAFVSNEFPIFAARNPARIDLRFLSYWFRQSRIWKVVEKDCQGSTPLTRNRYKEEFFNALRVPLPPLAEQRRIVTRLDTIESRLSGARKFQEESHAETQALTISLHHHLAKGRVSQLSDLLHLDEEQQSIRADGSYPQVGIRSFGEGMFRKPATLGSDTTYRSFNVLRAGRLVMSQVKGWEGAVAVCPAELDGWFVSPEYRTFSCRDGKCDANYLAHLVKTRWFREHLVSATRGVGARRERIRPEMLLSIEIPFPDLAGQRAALKSIERLTQAQALISDSLPHTEALLPSLLDRIFNHKPAVE